MDHSETAAAHSWWRARQMDEEGDSPRHQTVRRAGLAPSDVLWRGILQQV